MCDRGRSVVDLIGTRALELVEALVVGFNFSGEWPTQNDLSNEPLSAAQRGQVPYSDADAVRDAGVVVRKFGRLLGTRKLRDEGLGRLPPRVEAAGGAKRLLRCRGLG